MWAAFTVATWSWPSHLLRFAGGTFLITSVIRSILFLKINSIWLINLFEETLYLQLSCP